MLNFPGRKFGRSGTRLPAERCTRRIRESRKMASRRRNKARKSPSQRISWLQGTLMMGAFAALIVAERRRPLRGHVEPKLRRDIRNLAVAALGAATLRVLEQPFVGPLSH